MDDKTLRTLEYDKILEKLAGYCSFPASAELARKLLPTSDIIEARRSLAETSESVRLFYNHSDLSVGGARDVRQAVDLANHGGVLLPSQQIHFSLKQLMRDNYRFLFRRGCTPDRFLRCRRPSYRMDRVFFAGNAGTFSTLLFVAGLWYRRKRKQPGEARQRSRKRLHLRGQSLATGG